MIWLSWKVVVFNIFKTSLQTSFFRRLSSSWVGRFNEKPSRMDYLDRKNLNSKPCVIVWVTVSSNFFALLPSAIHTTTEILYIEIILKYEFNSHRGYWTDHIIDDSWTKWWLWLRRLQPMYTRKCSRRQILLST